MANAPQPPSAPGPPHPSPARRAWWGPGLAVGLVGVLVVVAVAAIVLASGTSDGDERTGATPAHGLDAEMAAARRVDDDVPAARKRVFDGDRALRLVRMQVEAGPRPAGSDALARVRRKLVAQLPRGRTEAVAGHPGLVNVVGRIPGRRPAVVLAAHYDTQIDPPGFVGANDSAAGTAVVLETARALGRIDRAERRTARRKGRRAPVRREVRFVLLDGEELPPGGDPSRFAEEGLRGSRAYAARHHRVLGSVVVADYVAGRGLRLPREPGSDTGLWRRVRAAADRSGVGAVFAGEGRTAIVDDHLPFLGYGVPAVTLIDWDHPVKNTADDRIDRLSVRAIDATGEAMVEWVRTERRR
ncbi:MAG: M28 family metallopeptidase [Solirubrobacteraceae bacterium]